MPSVKSALDRAEPPVFPKAPRRVPGEVLLKEQGRLWLHHRFRVVKITGRLTQQENMLVCRRWPVVHMLSGIGFDLAQMMSERSTPAILIAERRQRATGTPIEVLRFETLDRQPTISSACMVDT